VAALTDQARDAWQFLWLETLLQDLRFAARLLVKDRWFSLVTVLVLALAIGATTAMFTMINAIVFRGLPVNDDRIVSISTRDQHGRETGISLPDFQDWHESAQSFSGMAAYFNIALSVSDDVQAPDLRGGPYISANVFRLLDVKPALGRDFLPDEDRRGAPGTAVLAHDFWQSRYGGDPTMVGRTIRVNDRPAVVIGVMPAGFKFPIASDLWVPLEHASSPAPRPRNARTHAGFARLRDGVTLQQARAELESIAAQLAQTYPETNAGIRPVVERFSERFGSRPVRGLLLTLMGAVAFVLLVACANVANLLLARSAHRAREISLRTSLGASRGRIVRQLIVESLLLASVAALAGIGVAFAAVRVFATQLPFKPYWVEWTPDVRVLAFLCITTVVTGLLFGVAPAFQVSRSRPGDVLKEDGRGGTGTVRVRRWTNGLLMTEFALTLMLLAGAGLMIRSFSVLYRASQVVDASNALTMMIRISGARYPTPEHRKVFYRAVEDRLRALPEIADVTMASNVPFAGGYPRSLAIDGRITPGEPAPTVSYITIGRRYFETLGLRLLRGRSFTELDGRPGHEHAIVNQRFAELYFPDEDPLGHRIRLSNTNVIASELPWVTIVGVSPTVRQVSNTDEPDPVVYLPFQGDAGYFAGLIVRPRGDGNGVTAAIRAELAKLDPALPLYGSMPLEEVMAGSRRMHRSMLTLIGVFAGFALMLASIGVYGVTAYAVAQRTQEIGIRVAIGADPSQVVWLFVRRAFLPLGLGLIVGVGGVYALGRLLSGLLVQTSALDPLTLISVSAMVVSVALAACFFPARRAARLDPIVALRYE
jgi:putative ABC transport system permease protein